MTNNSYTFPLLRFSNLAVVILVFLHNSYPTTVHPAPSLKCLYCKFLQAANKHDPLGVPGMLIDWVLVDVLFSLPSKEIFRESRKRFFVLVFHILKKLDYHILYMIPLQYFKRLVVGLMNKSQGAVFWAGSLSVSAFAKENKTSTPWFLLFRAPWVSWHSTFGPVLSLGQHYRAPEPFSGSFLRHFCSRSLGCPKIMNCGFGATR